MDFTFSPQLHNKCVIKQHSIWFWNPSRKFGARWIKMTCFLLVGYVTHGPPVRYRLASQLCSLCIQWGKVVDHGVSAPSTALFLMPWLLEYHIPRSVSSVYSLMYSLGSWKFPGLIGDMLNNSWAASWEELVWSWLSKNFHAYNQAHMEKPNWVCNFTTSEKTFLLEDESAKQHW